MCLYIIYEDFFDTFGTELVSNTLATQFLSSAMYENSA